MRPWFAATALISCVGVVLAMMPNVAAASTIPPTPAAVGVAAAGGSTTLEATDVAPDPLAQVADTNLGITGADAALWIAEKVAGGIIGAAAGKGFNEILAQLGADKTSAALDAIKAKLEQIQAQLDRLQETMNVALQEIEKTQYAVLVGPVKDLRDRILGAQGDFLEALSYAGKPDKKSTVDQLIANVRRKVDDPGGLADRVGVVPEAILSGPLTPKPMYQALANVVTKANTTKFFTWRQSAGLDDVFQYLLYLQALQFNLIAQVKTMDGSSTDQIYSRFAEPYLGDRQSFQNFLDHKVPQPTKGALHDETVAELRRVPEGAVIQVQTGLMWSVDVPGGARDLGLAPSGPGYPVCSKPVPPVHDPDPIICLTRPTITVGLSPRVPGSPAADLAERLAKSGAGAAAAWTVPTLQQEQGLLAGWDGSGSPKTFLESQSGSNPATCKAVRSGGEGLSDPQSCIWPAPFYWSDAYDFGWQDITRARIFRSPEVLRRYNVGWEFHFWNITNNSVGECWLTVKQLNWSNSFVGDLSPQGPIKDYPPSKGCGGSLVMVRPVSGVGERFWFPL